MPEPLGTLLKDATARLIGRPVTPQDRFGLAVSGGADSMAMLAAAHALWPGQIEAATVDHGLRAGAREEAEMVAHWCAAHDVPHAILRPETPITGNVQARARAVRYALLETWRAERGLDWLLTAHQADDQIETVVMRLNRGSGVNGLASVRARQGRLLRPLLGVRRATLREHCREKDVPFADDPSNEDHRFDRARLREALCDADLFDPAGVARSVEALGDTVAALDWMVRRLEEERVTAQADFLTLDPADLPRELVRRLLLGMIEKTNPHAQPPRGPSLDQALVQLFDGKTVTLADCILTGGPRWTVRRAPPRSGL